MAQKISYTDVVHALVSEADDPLSLEEIAERLAEQSATNLPKNPRNTVRSTIRISHLIKPVGKSRYAWLPKLTKDARFRHTLTSAELADRVLMWDSEAWVALWPAADEAERRREREPWLVLTDDDSELSLAIEDVGDKKISRPESAFWAWLTSKKAEVGDDLIFTVTDPNARTALVRLEPRTERNLGLIGERNRYIKKEIENFLVTQREGVASPAEISAVLLSMGAYKDSVPPQSLSNLLSPEITERYGAAVELDALKSEKPSNVIPFPTKPGAGSGESMPAVSEVIEGGGIEFTIPYNNGQELPDDKAYLQAMEELTDAARPSPALAIHVLGISKLCSPAYALLSQTAEYRKEAFDLAGQSVIAAERRIAHGFIESLISGQEFAVEEALATYLESRCFLARALWHGGNFDEALEQAMHCFEIDPENPAVREDLFVMLFESGRHDIVLSLLDSFGGASETESLYHRALVALLDSPGGKDAVKILRKATTHNPYLASLFLGEEPKKARKSQVDEGTAYEHAYGFLWRREDAIFDLLEEIILAKR